MGKFSFWKMKNLVKMCKIWLNIQCVTFSQTIYNYVPPFHSPPSR